MADLSLEEGGVVKSKIVGDEVSVSTSGTPSLRRLQSPESQTLGTRQGKEADIQGEYSVSPGTYLPVQSNYLHPQPYRAGSPVNIFIHSHTEQVHQSSSASTVIKSGFPKAQATNP